MSTPRIESPEHQQQHLLKRFGLYGLLAHYDEVRDQPWLQTVLQYEQTERQHRSLERRLRNARIGRFKPMSDFDWSWPTLIDREAIDELFTFRFVTERSNVILVGPNGVGKSMIAQNLAHLAVIRGHTVRFTTASALLNDLASQDGATGLRQRLRRYINPLLLVIDEVGYLSYDNRYADLLFEVVTQRYGERSIVVTTNKSFNEWSQVFPNAACVVTLVDRLIHNAEIIEIQAESFRLKEAQERASARAKERLMKSKGKGKGDIKSSSQER